MKNLLVALFVNCAISFSIITGLSSCESRTTTTVTTTTLDEPDFDLGTELGRYARTKHDYPAYSVFAIPNEDNRMFVVTEKCGRSRYVFYNANDDNQPTVVDIAPCVEGKASTTSDGLLHK